MISASNWSKYWLRCSALTDYLAQIDYISYSNGEAYGIVVMIMVIINMEMLYWSKSHNFIGINMLTRRQDNKMKLLLWY